MCRRQLFVVMVVFALLGAACGSDGDDARVASSDETGTNAAESPAEDDEAEPSEDDDAAESADDSAVTEASAPTGTTARVEPADETGTEDEAPATPSPIYDFSEISPVVEAFIDEHDLNGAGLIVVEREAGVVHHEHWGVFDEDRISLIASSSKQITAGVLLHLDDRGVLDIDAPIAEIVDWGAANPDVTTAQLLSNSSGLVGLLRGAEIGAYSCQYAPAGTMQDCAETIFTTDADDAEVVPPDTEFRYGGAQWQIAGAVAEAASGMSWSQLIDEIYKQPCGLRVLEYNNHFAQVGPSGFTYPTEFDNNPAQLVSTENPNMEGGSYITTAEYGELLLMQLRGGVCGETQVLSPEALAAMHGDRVAEAYDGDAGGSDTGYGMGWWVNRETGYISDPGAYGSVPWLDLADGYGAFLVTEADSGLGVELTGQLQPIVDAAIAGTS